MKHVCGHGAGARMIEDREASRPCPPLRPVTPGSPTVHGPKIRTIVVFIPGSVARDIGVSEQENLRSGRRCRGYWRRDDDGWNSEREREQDRQGAFHLDQSAGAVKMSEKPWS